MTETIDIIQEPVKIPPVTKYKQMLKNYTNVDKSVNPWKKSDEFKKKVKKTMKNNTNANGKHKYPSTRKPVKLMRIKVIRLSDQDRIRQKKKKFISYYKDLPIQKLGADFIGVTDETITRWKYDDPVFLEQMNVARSNWTMKKSKGVRSKEWLLERVIRDHFAPKGEIELGMNKELEQALDRISKLLPESH